MKRPRGAVGQDAAMASVKHGLTMKKPVAPATAAVSDLMCSADVSASWSVSPEKQETYSCSAAANASTPDARRFEGSLDAVCFPSSSAGGSWSGATAR